MSTVAGDNIAKYVSRSPEEMLGLAMRNPLYLRELHNLLYLCRRCMYVSGLNAEIEQITE